MSPLRRGDFTSVLLGGTQGIAANEETGLPERYAQHQERSAYYRLQLFQHLGFIQYYIGMKHIQLPSMEAMKLAAHFN
jgi:hypothetical protein